MKKILLIFLGLLALSVLNSSAANPYGVGETGTRKDASQKLETSPKLLVFSVTVTQVRFNKCYGDTIAALVATVSGGVGPYQYQWIPGHTITSAALTDTLKNLGPGSFTVWVKDMTTLNIVGALPVIPAIQNLTIGGFNRTEPSCNGGCDGSISPSILGGTPFGGGTYSCSWKPGNQITQNLTNICAGPDTLHVTDANGCKTSLETTLTQPTALVAHGSSTNISCNGTCDGTGTVAPTGATPPYTYSWNTTPVKTTASVSNLCPSPPNYVCTIKDANLCPVTYTVTITQPASGLTAIVAKTDVLCSGGSTGSATITVSGGTSPYNYSWTPCVPPTSGCNTLTVTGLVAGTYTCNITDANGCPLQKTVTISTLNITPVATATPAIQTICSGNNAISVFTSTVPLGTTYNWIASASSPSITGFSTPGSGIGILEPITNSGITVGTVTYTITPTGPPPSSCPGTPITFVVTVNPTPLVTNSPLTQTICSGTSTTLVNLTSNLIGTTYSWTASATAGVSGFTAGGTSTIPVQTISTIGSTSGTVTYTITPTGPPPSSCPGTPVNYTVTVDPKPIVTNAPLTQTICSGSSTTLVNLTSNVTNATFAWTATATAGVSGFTAGGTSTIPVQTISTTGSSPGLVTYTITPTGPAPSLCMGIPSTYTVVVDPKPIVTNSPLSQSICSGGSTALVNLTSDVAGATFAWTASASPGVNGFTASGTSTIPVQTITTNQNIAGTVTYTITPTGPAPSICPGTTATYTVNVVPKPSVTNAPLAQSICSGDNTTLVNLTSDVFGSTFAWTAVATTGITGFTASGTNTIPVQTISTSGNTSGTVIYIITPTGPAPASCVGDPVNYTITVYPDPAITNFPLTQTICSGGNTSLVNLISNVTGATFIWTASATAGVSGFSAGGTSTIPVQTISTTGNSPGTVTYTITPTGPAPSLCVGIPSNYTVVVDPKPTVTNSPLTQSICSGNSSTLVNLTSNVLGTTYTWTATATAGISGFTASGTNTIPIQTITSVLNTAGTVTYFITPTGPPPSSCPGTPVNYTITVNPTAIATPALDTICSGDITNILLTSNVLGTTYSWTVAQTNVSGAFDGFGNSIAQLLTATTTSPGTATYTITPIANGCPGPPINVTVRVNPVPVLTATPALQTICSGSPTSIALSADVAGTTFAWSIVQSNVNGGSPGVINSIAQTLTATAPLGLAVYTITPTANGCAGQLVNVNVTVKQIPIVTSSPPSQSVCSGSSSALVLSSNVVGTSYTWTVVQTNVTGATPGNGSFINQALNVILPTLSGTAVYTITPTINGCPGLPIKDTVTVNPTPSATAAPALQTICSGENTSILLSSNVIGATYSWAVTPTNVSGATASNGNFINQTLTATGVNNGIATYSVTPSFNGCPGTPIAVPVTVLLPIAATIDTTMSNCGVCAGTILVTPTTGTAPYTFSWLPSPFVAPGTFVSTTTSSDATSLCAGLYSVTVLDNNGCQAQFSIGLNNSNGISGETVTKTDISCFGGCTGTGSVVPIGGTAPYSFTWYDSLSNPVAHVGNFASGLCAGDYQVMVGDLNGCVHFSPVSIGQPSGSMVGTITAQQNIPCFGDGNVGSVTISGSNGVPGYQYSKNGGAFQYNGTFNGLGAATYTITVKDTNNCPITVPVTITEPGASVTAAFTNQINVLCRGAATGCVTITGSGGTPPYTFKKGTGGFLASGNFCNLVAGPYTFTVKDSSGCTSPVVVTITEPLNGVSAALSSKTDVLCKGDQTGALTVSGLTGTSPFLYSIDSISYQPTGTFTNLLAGKDTLVVMDALGCVDTVQVTINEPSFALSETVSTITNVLCKGDSTGCVTVSITGGTPGYSFSKNGVTFQASPTFCNLLAGSYIINAKDAHGCTDTVHVTISEPLNPLIASIGSQTNVLCKGNSTGCVTIAGSGGTPNYSYSKNGGAFQLSGTFCNLLAGAYIFTIKDANACTDTIHVTISEPTFALSASVGSQTNILCKGTASGCLTIAPSGGTSPYTYSIILGVYQASATFCNLTAGPDTIRVTDSNGCTADVQFNITEPAIALRDSITSQTDVLCNGNNSGSVTALAINGTPGFLFILNSNILITNHNGIFTSLYAGKDTIIVMDTIGCVAFVPFEITQPPFALTGSIVTQTDLQCYGGANNGSITVIAANGTPGYKYTLGNVGPQFSGTFNNLPAGAGTILVTDTIGCTANIPFTINQPPALAISTAITQPSNCGASDGIITVTPTTGIPPYTFTWVPAVSNINTPLSSTASNLAGGLYSITVTDNNGCDSTFQIPLNNTGGPSNGTVDSVDATCPGSCNGFAWVVPSGGISPYTYLWNDPALTTNDTAIDLCAGNYFVKITDASGCVFNSPVKINEPAPIVITGALTDAACSGICTGAITATIAGGTPGFTYNWSPATITGQGTPAISGLCPGTYTLNVTDANLCPQANSFVIGQSSPLSVTIHSTNSSCAGACNGIAYVTITAGTPPFTVQWNDGQVRDTATSLCPGIYTAIVTDFSGCNITLSIPVTEPDPIIANAVITNATCGAYDGQVVLAPTGGMGSYSYLWSINNQTTSTVTNLCSGLYSVDITDGVGCAVNVSIPVSNSNGPSSATITKTDVSCFGLCDGTVTGITPVGGTAPYSYHWITGGQVTPTRINLCEDVYYVEVIDAIGCSLIDSVIIMAPPPIVANSIITAATCNLCDGKIIIDPSGGPGGPYTVQWNTGATIDTLTNLCAGIYSVFITGSGGCFQNVAIPVQSYGGPSVTISSTSDMTCNGIIPCNGTATVAATGGVSPYFYIWNDPFVQTTPTADSLCAGTYLVEVIGSDLCVSITSATIYEPPAMGFGIANLVDPLCNGNTNGFINVFPSGGILPYSYSWTNSSSVGDTAYNLGANTYIVTVTDANNCTASQTNTLTEPPALTISHISTNPICNTAANGAIDITVAGGSPIYTYQWSGMSSATTQDINNLFMGTYHITATDSRGCTISDGIVLTPLTSVVANAGRDTSFCESKSVVLNGIGSINATGYQWYHVSPSFSIGNSMSFSVYPPPGVTGYYLVVNNSAGCTDNDTVIYTSNPLPTAEAGSDVTILSQESTTIGGNPTGPMGSNYMWTPSLGLDFNTTSNPVSTPNGTTTYYVLVTSDKGCTSKDSVVVTVLPYLNPASGFTPNGDGANDEWLIDNIQLFPDCMVEIYNRWGELLFQSPGYKDHWKGIFKGKPLPVGTYYYIIKLNDPRFPDAITGPITIMR